jgi:F-box interacting protein
MLTEALYLKPSVTFSLKKKVWALVSSFRDMFESLVSLFAIWNAPQNMDMDMDMDIDKDMDKDMELWSLPQDVITDILTRLPIKSLMRFKCVNKPWRNFVRSSAFGTLHFRRNKDKPMSYISMSDTRMQLLTEDGKHNGYLHRSFMPESNKYGRLPRGYIIGSSSNGLVCVKKGYACNFTIWNPATRESRYIQESREFRHGCNKRFGFDVRPCGDYRVVVIQFRDAGLVKVHKFSKNSTYWKEISEDGVGPVPAMELAYPTVVCLDGSMYWTMYKNKDEVDVCLDLACFDMWEEKYRLISGPPCLSARGGRLGVFYGTSLGFFFFGEVGGTLDGWIMNCHDGSWSKHFSVVPYLKMPVQSDGELAMMILDELIFFYHRATKQIVYFPTLANHLDVVQYKEAVFSV